MRCREAALQFLQSALAPCDYTHMHKAPDPPQQPALLPPAMQPASRALHPLLSHIPQPSSSKLGSEPHQAQAGWTTTSSSLPLHQEVLQQSQSQHHTFHRLIKICADLALGSSALLPASNQQPDVSAAAAPTWAGEVDRWVLLGRLLEITNGFVHVLNLSREAVVPDQKRRQVPQIIQDILLHMTAIADATGQAQRWVCPFNTSHAC